MKKIIALLVVLMLNINCSSDSNDTAACTPIACLNGGTSNSNCGCNCTIGFTGPNCSNQITPTKILITQIKVKNFPNKKTDGVTTWDDYLVTSLNSPDIFPFLTLGSINLFQGAALQDVISNGNGTDNFTWNPTTPIQIVAINSQFTINLYDADLGNPGYEFMGGYNFNLYNSTGGFPTTITLSNSTSPYKFELTVSYVW
jgi:hypothetical protein